MTLKAINKLLRPIRRSVQLMIGRAVLESVKAEGGFQTVKITGIGGVFEGCELFEQYGITSHPPKESEGLIATLGGSSDHCVVINMGARKFRLKGLEEGEVALYDDLGSKVVLKRDKSIEVECENKVTIKTKDVDIDGNLSVTGAITGDSTIAAAKDITSDANIKAAKLLEGADCKTPKTTLNTFFDQYTPHIHDVAVAPGPTTPPK